MNPSEERLLVNWITERLVAENFNKNHLVAIARIVGLINDCKESEKEVLGFASYLHEKYAA